jgi:uncharacterized membrane protein YraQ (UPF0718 family)
MNDIVNFKSIFLSIIIEAMPFMLIGVLVSSFINLFVSEDILRRLIPRNQILGILTACFAGLIFPVCECGIVPVARRLLAKGLPVGSVVAFMLASPVINPVVAVSTAVAFNGSWLVAALRLSLAFIVAASTSFIVGNMMSSSTRFQTDQGTHACVCECHHSHASPAMLGKAIAFLKDSSAEFFEMGKYLILGALLSALAQTFITHSAITEIGKDELSSIAAMMLFALGISVCSTSDAFIAASFSGSFTLGSLLAFMVMGPMVDLKNMIMFVSTFRLRLILVLSLLVALFTGGGALLVNKIVMEVL